jgi:hypothetical protein
MASASREKGPPGGRGQGSEFQHPAHRCPPDSDAQSDAKDAKPVPRRPASIKVRHRQTVAVAVARVCFLVVPINSLYRTHGSPMRCELAGLPEGSALKVTVDSSESLEDVLRVVGALYDVTLVLAQNTPEADRPTQEPSAAPKQRSARTKPRNRGGAAENGASKSRTARRTESAGAPSNAEVRSWARQTGLNVSDRGRVPASVMAAYRNAHQ